MSIDQQARLQNKMQEASPPEDHTISDDAHEPTMLLYGHSLNEVRVPHELNELCFVTYLWRRIS